MRIASWNVNSIRARLEHLRTFLGSASPDVLCMQETKVEDVCSSSPTTVSADDSIQDAIKCMRDENIRRVPVVDGDKPVGIVSLGDLAQEQDPNSVLGDISAAAPNN